MDVTFEIVKHIVTLNQNGNYSKQVNMVSWNGDAPVLDIRTWNGDKPLRGVTIKEGAEAERLISGLTKIYSAGA